MEDMKFISETNFKPTEIGEIPEDWDVVKLGEMVEVDRQKIGKADFKGEVPLVQKINFESGLIILREKRNTNTDLFLGQANRLLISKINFHQGAVSITDREIAATTHYEFFKVLHLADLHFLWIYFRTPNFKNVFAQEIKFRGFKKEANFRYLKNFSIPLPPLSEQKAIAYVLSTIQEAVEKTKKVIEATKELKKSLMRHLFTYGPVPLSEVDKVKLKETEIGEIPEDWKVVRLGEISNVKTSFPAFNSISELDTHKNDDEVVLALKVSDMNYFTNQKYINESQITFHYQKVKLNNSHFLRPESIIFPKRGGAIGTNKKRITKSYSILDPNLIGVEPSREVIAEYLFGFFEQFDLRSLQDNTPIPQLNKHQVESIMFPLPPLPIQQKIAEILSAVDEKIQAEEKKKRALENLFKSMLSNLMTGKIRVKELG